MHVREKFELKLILTRVKKNQIKQHKEDAMPYSYKTKQTETQASTAAHPKNGGA